MAESYNIGGVVSPTDASEAFADIPQNRVLMAEKLTTRPENKPKIVHGLTNIEQVFAHYKPSVDVDFETEDGASKKETLRFNGLGDFGVKGISAQSNFISDTVAKKEQYQKIIKQLKSNKQLREALKNNDAKKALLDAVHAFIKELDMPK